MRRFLRHAHAAQARDQVERHVDARGDAGLLAGKRATTHWTALDLLASLDQTIRVERGVRFVEDGIVSSAGVAAGIDMSFHLVARLCGLGVAEETARYIEYPWKP